MVSLIIQSVSMNPKDSIIMRLACIYVPGVQGYGGQKSKSPLLPRAGGHVYILVVHKLYELYHCEKTCQ